MKYTCDACKGTVHVSGRKQSIDEVRAVHEATCPTALHVKKLRK